jgi:hypothetical protein
MVLFLYLLSQNWWKSQKENIHQSIETDNLSQGLANIDGLIASYNSHLGGLLPTDIPATAAEDQSELAHARLHLQEAIDLGAEKDPGGSQKQRAMRILDGLRL